MSLSGCGYISQVNKKVEYQTVALGPHRGDLYQFADSTCQPCTEEYLRSNWGEPTSRSTDESGNAVWSYNNGLKWVGASPVVIIPLPLFVPSGQEKVIFGIRNGRIMYVQHHTVKRTFFYFPITNGNNITGNLYVSTAPPAGCIFKQVQ